MNRPGFRKTKIGWIPEDWTVMTVGQLFDVQLGKMLNQKARKGETQYPYLGNTNVQWGRINTANLQEMSFSEKEREKFALRAGDLLVCEGGEVGRTAIWRNEVATCFYQKAIHRLRALDGLVIPDFMLLYMNYVGGGRILSDLTSRSSIAHLTREKLLKLPVIVPPIFEQETISQVFMRLDRRMELTEQLVAATLELKRGLVQHLLTGKRRFEEFAHRCWQQMRICDFTILRHRVRSKPDNEFTALGIRSHGKGTFLKHDFDPSKIEMTELFEVKENDLIVNITFAWEGAIAIAGASDDTALVSHRFPTYEFKRELAIPEFFRHVIRQKWFIEKLGIISPGGAGRNRVLSKKDFGKLEVLMPSVEEQRRIAAVLNACDKEIELLKQQLDALKLQKRGLMQKLLTGQIRVKFADQIRERFSA